MVCKFKDWSETINKLNHVKLYGQSIFHVMYVYAIYMYVYTCMHNYMCMGTNVMRHEVPMH